MNDWQWQDPNAPWYTRSAGAYLHAMWRLGALTLTWGPMAGLALVAFVPPPLALPWYVWVIVLTWGVLTSLAYAAWRNATMTWQRRAGWFLLAFGVCGALSLYVQDLLGTPTGGSGLRGAAIFVWA
jgi:hypothetical protein